VVLGIAGCSGSGKTTLAVELARTLNGIHFPLDNYYRDLAHLPLAERVRQNFDDPALIEAPLLAAHVAALARGEAIERPVYDFASYTRVPGVTETFHAPFLIVEGLLTVVYPELLPLYHLRVYVDTPDEVCFDHRLRRDVEQRGRTPESVRRQQYDGTVRPSAAACIRPSSVNADLLIDGVGPLDWKVERVLSELRARGFPRNFLI
jgi:uridine kinase